MRRILQSLRPSLLRLTKSTAQWFSLDTAFLLLLSAWTTFSLLSLAVHLIDRSIDKTLTVQLSADGKELIQLRNTGLATIDVETGAIKDQLRFFGVWENSLNPWNKRRDFDTSPTFGREEIHRWAECDLTQDASIILFRLPTQELVWWNRRTKTYRVITVPRTDLLEVTLNESKNRFYLHTAKRPEDPFTKPTPEEIARRATPKQFDAIRDVRTYELSTGNLVSVAEQIPVGQAVQNRPNLRVGAKEGKIELLDWSHFPETPSTVLQTYQPDPSLFKQLVAGRRQMFRWSESHSNPAELVYVDPVLQGGSDQHSSYIRLTRFTEAGIKAEDFISLVVKKKHSQALDEIEGFIETCFLDDEVGPAHQIRIFERESYKTFSGEFAAEPWETTWTAARVAPDRIRLASNQGTILDYSTTERPDCRHWEIALPPYKTMPPQLLLGSLGLLAVALSGFLFERFKLSARNITYLLVAIAWPLVLTGIERGFSSDPYANSLAALSGVILIVLLSYCCIQILTHKHPLPWLTLMPSFILALLAVSAAISEEYFYWAKSLSQFFGLPEH